MSEVTARELIVWREVEYCTVYSGSMRALVAAGVATLEQFPTGLNGENRTMKSGGYAGHRASPGQRWKVRRRGRDLFDVFRWHQLRPIRPAVERFMNQVLAVE